VVGAVAFSPDAMSLHQLHLITQCGSGMALPVLGCRHSMAIRSPCVAFSPESKVLVSASSDGQWLWDDITGACQTGNSRSPNPFLYLLTRWQGLALTDNGR